MTHDERTELQNTGKIRILREKRLLEADNIKQVEIKKIQKSISGEREIYKKPN